MIIHNKMDFIDKDQNPFIPSALPQNTPNRKEPVEHIRFVRIVPITTSDRGSLFDKMGQLAPICDSKRPLPGD